MILALNATLVRLSQGGVFPYNIAPLLRRMSELCDAVAALD